MTNKRKHLIDAFRGGNLIVTAYELSHGSEENRNTISALLSDLHNKGDLDLIEAYSRLKMNESGGVDFFLARQLFENALPTLSAPVEEVMACVQHLAREAGYDLAANSVFEPFIGYLLADKTRVSQALAAIKDSPNKWSGFVCPVLLAGAQEDIEDYFGHAVDLTSHEISDVCINAVYALGKISYPDTSLLPEQAIELVEKIALEEHDDGVMGVVIKTASSLARLDDSLVEKARNAMLNALKNGSDQALHAASEEFGFHSNVLPDRILDLIISSFPRVKSENRGSIKNIDFGISRLLKKGDYDRSIECLETVLQSNAEELNVKIFNSVINEILTGDPNNLSKLLTRWFYKGDRVFCTAVTDIIGHIHGNQISLEIDVEGLPDTDPFTLIFIARKAIGYLFFNPITVVSIIISLLRSTKEGKAMKDLEELLLNPVLFNYPGAARQFLADRIPKESKPVATIIKSALNRLDDYQDNLRHIGEIPELHPTLLQREASSRKFSQEMSESYKQAMKGSIVELIATKSVLLYGRTSVNYIQQGPSDATRMEIPMKKHSVEMDFPMRHNLDPFGVDYMLRVFRAETLV